MDRSYLSNQEVITASRNFVCARLLTYENAEEGAMLESIFRGRSGLENSVFAILAADGETKLTRSGRSPSFVYRDAAEMAAAMRDIAKQHPGLESPEPVGLPLLADVRRGLNAARADAQQLVIVFGDAKPRAALEAKLAELAWSEPLLGKFLYARADDQTDWTVIEGSEARPATGLVVVEPGEFGLDGRVIATLGPEPTERALLAATEGHDASAVDTRRQRRKGARAGIKWETVIPVTDPGGDRQGEDSPRRGRDGGRGRRGPAPAGFEPPPRGEQPPGEQPPRRPRR